MRIGAYQFAVTGNIESNYHGIQNGLQQAVQNNVEFLIFPECALTGYPPHDIEKASSVDFHRLDSIYEDLQSIADKHALYIIVGSIENIDGLCYNSALLFAPCCQRQVYHKRALWGWDRDNFCKGQKQGVFDVNGWQIGIRICFEVRFPEFFRELYQEDTDLNVILFYDVSAQNSLDRYDLIKAHVRTRAVENVTYTLTVNACSPYQTAPTMLCDRSGYTLKELIRNKEGLLIFDLSKEEMNFGEQGRKEISDCLTKG